MHELTNLIPAIMVASCLSANVIHMVNEALNHMKFLEGLSGAFKADDFALARMRADDELGRLVNLRSFAIAAGFILVLQLTVMVPLIFLGLLPKIFLHTLVSMPIAALVVITRRLAAKLAKRKADKAYRRNTPKEPN